MNNAAEDRLQKSVLNLYAMFGASCILSVLPYPSAAFLSLVFFVVVLSWAYSIRKSAKAHSFAWIHADYLIRTIWVSGLFALITTVIAGIYVTNGLNHAAFDACANDLASKGPEWIAAAGYQGIYDVIQPCIHGFIALNETLLINGVIIAGGPVLIYMGYRLYKGLHKALGGYILPENKNWF